MEDVPSILTFARRVRDTLEVFLKCFIPLRDGYQEFEVGVLARDRESTEGDRVAMARDDKELSAVLLGPTAGPDAVRHLREIFVEVMSHQIAEFTRQVISLVGGIVLLTVMQPQLTLTALAVVPVVVISGIFFGRRVKRATTGVQERVGEATAMAEEALSHIRVVQGFVQERREAARYDAGIGEVIRSALHRARVRALFFGVLTFGADFINELGIRGELLA